jgi:hypothetical protein
MTAFPKHAFRIPGIARTLRSTALRRGVEPAAWRSIAVEAKSSSPANAIEYSCMRMRKVSTRKSGMILDQGLRSGAVDLLVTSAHATKEGRAWRAALRIKATAVQLPTDLFEPGAPAPLLLLAPCGCDSGASRNSHSSR